MIFPFSFFIKYTPGLIGSVANLSEKSLLLSMYSPAIIKEKRSIAVGITPVN
jgi:hypothetical protein